MSRRDAAGPPDATARQRGRPRRYDPDRRERIIDATLEVIADVGVAGASHRRIAARADVPLGSMTYHFTDRDELLRLSFERFAVAAAVRFEQRLAGAASADEAREAIIELVHEDLLGSQRELVITAELYTLAAREPGFRTLTRDWMARSRRVFRRFFDEPTTHLLDAVIEGLYIHAALDTEPPDRARTAEAVRRITAA
jgi:DNA-binding transcriptional regulator YbjK